MRLLIVGCGYVGQRLVGAVPDDWQVTALTRSEESAQKLQALGVEPIVGHWLQPATLTALPAVDQVLVSVPHRPEESAEFEPEQTHRVGLEVLLEALPAGWQKCVYLSTTGVYGDCAGERVNEQTPVAPSRVGPQIAVAAEDWLRQSFGPNRLTILRLAGIYGPGRIPLAQKLLAGEPLAVPQQGYLNLVHVADIVQMIQAVFRQELSDSTFVFSDGQPVERTIFYRYLAQLCGVDEPRFETPPPEASRSRRATSKRIDPSRLVEEVGYRYVYPSYREGLQEAIGELLGRDRDSA